MVPPLAAPAALSSGAAMQVSPVHVPCTAAADTSTGFEGCTLQLVEGETKPQLLPTAPVADRDAEGDTPTVLSPTTTVERSVGTAP